MEIAHFNWSTAGLRMMRTSTEKREIHQEKKQFGDGETMEKTNKLSHEIPQPPMLSREPNPSKEGICWTRARRRQNLKGFSDLTGDVFFDQN